MLFFLFGPKCHPRSTADQSSRWITRIIFYSFLSIRDLFLPRQKGLQVRPKKKTLEESESPDFLKNLPRVGTKAGHPRIHT